MSYVNVFGFLLSLSNGLTVCYSFLLFYFVICGDFNFLSSYSMIETEYNMMFGMVGFAAARRNGTNVPIALYSLLHAAPDDGLMIVETCRAN